jgi:hypothetical protein
MGAAEEALLQRLSAAFCSHNAVGKVCTADVERARNVLLLVGTHGTLGRSRSDVYARRQLGVEILSDRHLQHFQNRQRRHGKQAFCSKGKFMFQKCVATCPWLCCVLTFPVACSATIGQIHFRVSEPDQTFSKEQVVEYQVRFKVHIHFAEARGPED